MNILSLFQIGIGFFGLVALAIPFSENPKIINYRYIIYAIVAQFALAVIFIKLPFIPIFFEFLAQGVTVLQEGTEQGAQFLFGYSGIESGVYPSLLSTFAFGILPYIIVMSYVSAILWNWGVLPFIVNIL